MKRFFFHYNKPASKAAKKVKLSLHFGGACNIVESIDCKVPIESHVKKRQPHCVMRGWFNAIKIEDNKAVIV